MSAPDHHTGLAPAAKSQVGPGQDRPLTTIGAGSGCSPATGPWLVAAPFRSSAPGLSTHRSN